MDFGFVILGDIVSKAVRIINNGFCPVSLYFLKSILHGTGFLVDVDRIRSLPGSPDFDITEFNVHFDPRGSNLDLGAARCEIPIHVISLLVEKVFSYFNSFWLLAGSEWSLVRFDSERSCDNAKHGCF